MVAYENDILVIPEKYKEMSVSELEEEKMRMLREIKTTERSKKAAKMNKNNIVFNF